MSFIDSYNPHLLDGVQHVHFIGCGGSGTYPLIQILHSRLPPITAAGSLPASSSMVVIMPVVVVLPWVPETQTLWEYMRLT